MPRLVNEESPWYAIYCERQGGWLCDSSFVFTWDAEQAAWFDSKESAQQAIEAMRANGHDIALKNCLIPRVK